MRLLLLLPAVTAALVLPGRLAGQPLVVDAALSAEIDRRTAAIADKVTAWRRDIHQHPELGYQETRTAGLVAAHLRKLGLEVQEQVGGIPGVVGILKGGRPGPTVALRADMDALPVTEMVDIPFKSTVRTVYNGQEVGVMHACGHDTHVAMLMGTAEVLTSLRDRLPGSVKFIFQPAEEVPPRGGALPMIEAGVMDGVDAIFGIHVGPGKLGTLFWRAGPKQASADNWKLIVRGRQGHGAMPSTTVDPIVIGAQIVGAYQTIISRQIDLATSPAVLTVGAFHGGLRENIIPDSVWMIGTVRTFDETIRGEIHARMKKVADGIAAASGATAELTIVRGYPVTVNNPALVARYLPTLKRITGTAGVVEDEVNMPAEDFSRYAQKAPGFFLGLGVTPPELPPEKVASNHSPFFQADDRALPVGVRTLSNLAVDFLRNGGPGKVTP